MNKSNISLDNVTNDNWGWVYIPCKHDEPGSDVEKIAKGTVIILLDVLGISLNMFVIILAAKFPGRKNFHCLIINMAVSDALFLFIRLLHEVSLLPGSWSIYPSGTLGVVIDVTLICLENISFRVSLITLLIIAIERFRSTRQTLQRSRRYTLRQRVLVVGLLSIVVGLLSFRISGLIFIENRIENYTIRIHVILIIILCSLIILLTILTTRRLSKPQAILANLSEEQQNIRKRRTLAAMRMIVVSALLYPLCWLTYFFISAAITIDQHLFGDCFDWDSLEFIGIRFLPVVNSCFSPCIYIIFLSDFRQAAKKVLLSKKYPEPSTKQKKFYGATAYGKPSSK